MVFHAPENRLPLFIIAITPVPLFLLIMKILRYRILSLLALVFTSLGAEAQSRAFIDSLKSAFAAEKSADGQCRMYNELSRTYSSVDQSAIATTLSNIR